MKALWAESRDTIVRFSFIICLLDRIPTVESSHDKISFLGVGRKTLPLEN